MGKSVLINAKIDLCADHVIFTERLMTNLVSNFECLFRYFSANIKIRPERSPIHSKLSLLSYSVASIKRTGSLNYFEVFAPP